MNRSYFAKALLLAAALLPGWITTLPAETLQYAITDLGDLGYRIDGAVAPAAGSQSYSINIHNQITGEATSPNGDNHAFLYSGGRMIDLGTLASGNTGLSYGHAINDQGVVVGQSENTNGEYNPFYYATGVPDAKMVDMGTLGGTLGGIAYGINNLNEIVGGASITNHSEIDNAFLSSVGGAMQDLGDLIGMTDTSLVGIAYAINRAGVVVGQSYNPNDTNYEIPFVDSGAGMTALPLLGSDATGNANAINSMGVIVGVSGSQAVAWTGGSAQGLGFLPATGVTPNSVAFGINDAGQIVGSSDVAFATPHAIIYQNGKLTDLNTLIAPGKSGGFTTLTYARSINNIGSITGWGLQPGHNGYFSFLAVPNIPTVIPPSPGVGAMVATEDAAAPDLGGASGSLTGSVFSTLGPPAIDKAGDIAFHATIKAPPKTTAVAATENSGIWLYQSNVGSLVAHTGDANNPAPDTNGALFTKLGDPVLRSSGDLAFLASYAGGLNKVKPSAGIFVTKSGVTHLAYFAGEAAPGLASTVELASFEEVAINNGGGVAFLATVKGTGITAANDSGLWATDGSGALQLVAQKGETTAGVKLSGLVAFAPLSEVDGQSRSLDAINGNAAFLGHASKPAAPATLFAAAIGSGSFTVTGKIGVGGAISSLTLTSIDEPIVNKSGSLAFLGTLAGVVSTKKLTAADDHGIGLIVGGSTTLEVQTGVTVAPDAAGAITAGAVFSKLSDPVLDNTNRYAFIGALEPGVGDTAKTGSNDAGIWPGVSGALTRVVRKGDAAPGTNGSFSAFEQLVLPDVNGPIFVASLSGVPAAHGQGLWAVNSSGLSLIVETGNSLVVGSGTKVVKSIGIFQTPTGVAGQSRSFDGPSGNLVYLAGFTDGTSGIFKVLAQ